ncbi:MAG: PIN domain-containing protein [Chloroflexi bacterium]|nr:PIN domain-containing protein [Chloroflexota bacterium]MBI5080518.1 PIN domain-containing protein [Chloroflexota bacterium]
MADRSRYVTDTHSLLWYLYTPERLGDGAKKAFNEVAEDQADLIVPMIVIAEIIYISKAGKVDADIKEVLSRLQSSLNITISPLTLDRALELDNISEVPEMHDRMIAAEAKLQSAILITRDHEISNSGVVSTIW